MPRKTKLFIFKLIGSLLELLILPIIGFISIFVRLFVYERKKSIFMGMMHINNWTYVAKALRKVGYHVQVIPWMIPEHEIGVIPYDVQLDRKYPLLYLTFSGQYILQFWIFIWAIFHFDIFITPFRARIFERTVWLKKFEIPLMHLAGKIVILNTYGADVATPRLRHRKDLKYSLYDGYINDPQYSLYDERSIARNTRLLEKQADCIISAIDHIDYLDRVDYYFHLRCIDTNKILPKYKTKNMNPVFVHAPNHRIIKGTDSIIKAIESLNSRGIKCDLKIIENTSNDILLEIIRDSDAVIDQLLLGTYARLSIEAMSLGKPVFCYLREDLYEYNPIWKHCPIINVNPETLEKSLECFIKNHKNEKHRIGMDGRKYIEKFHSLEAIGSRCSQIIQEVISR